MSTKHIVKNGAHGGARPRSALGEIKKRRDAQRLVLHEIIRHFGGLAAISLKTADALDLESLTVQNWSNWRSRGSVPVNMAFRIARALKIDPRALNYRGASALVEDKRSWQQVVNSVEFFDRKMKEQILSYRGPK